MKAWLKHISHLNIDTNINIHNTYLLINEILINEHITYIYTGIFEKKNVYIS